jgi:DNA-binding transcriptional ArsR family regulator
MQNKNILDFEARSRIYSLIQKKPGLHLSELSRRLDIPITTLRYHLHHLAKRQLLLLKNERGFSRYYIVDNVGNKDKEMLKILRSKTLRHIILYLYATVGASLKEISEGLGKHPNTTKFHLKKLLDLEIIEVADHEKGIIFTKLETNAVIDRSIIGREKVYRLKNPHVMDDILIRNLKNKSFDDKLIKNIIDYIYDLCPETPKRVFTSKESVNRIEDVLFDIFPHPYHP